MHSNRINWKRVNSIFAILAMVQTCSIFPALADSMCLIDYSGKTILPPEYARLSYCGSGLYRGRKKNETRDRILNSDGRELPFKLPPNYIIEDIFIDWDAPKATLQHIPPNALIKVLVCDKFGLYDGTGKVILRPEFSHIYAIGDGILWCARDSNGEEINYLFDSKTKQLSRRTLVNPMYGVPSEGLVPFHNRPSRNINDWNQEMGYCDYQNQIKIKPNFETASEFHEGFAKVTIEKANNTIALYVDHKGQLVNKNILAVSNFNAGRAIAAKASAPSLLGIIDRKFQFIVEPQYQTLIDLNQGMYACKRGAVTQFSAITATGKHLFNFPTSITGFPDQSQKNSRSGNIVADCNEVAPVDGLLTNRVIFDRSGKRITAPTAFGIIDGDLISIIESDTVVDRKQGLMTTQGKWLFKPEDSYFQPTERNRIIKTIRDVHFNAEEWQKPISPFNSTRTVSRERNLAYFLKDYDIVGMPESEIHRLLGRGQIDNGIESYSLTETIGCGRMHSLLSLDYENGRVKRWRLDSSISSISTPKWLTKNMLLSPACSYFQLSLIPKYPDSSK